MLTTMCPILVGTQKLRLRLREFLRKDGAEKKKILRITMRNKNNFFKEICYKIFVEKYTFLLFSSFPSFSNISLHPNIVIKKCLFLHECCYLLIYKNILNA